MALFSKDKKTSGYWSTKVYDKKQLDAFAQAFSNLGVGSKSMKASEPDQVWATFATNSGVDTQTSGQSGSNAISPTEEIIKKVEGLKSVFASRVEEINTRTSQPGRQQTIFTR